MDAGTFSPDRQLDGDRVHGVARDRVAGQIDRRGVLTGSQVVKTKVAKSGNNIVIFLVNSKSAKVFHLGPFVIQPVLDAHRIEHDIKVENRM